MTVLSTFLESPLNFLSNNMKNTTKFGTVRDRIDVKVWNVRNTVLKGRLTTKSSNPFGEGKWRVFYFWNLYIVGKQWKDTPIDQSEQVFLTCTAPYLVFLNLASFSTLRPSWWEKHYPRPLFSIISHTH